MLDMLLKLLGENPAGYPTMTDKFAGIIAALLGLSTTYLRYILFIIPLIWLFCNKKRGGNISRLKVIITMIVSILLFVVGVVLPDLIFEGMWGLMVRGIYGGQI